MAWAPLAHAQLRRSIQNWAICGGKADDAVATASAFAAAAQGHFTLVVDCPIFIHIGMDVTRPIFIDNGTTIVFSGNGQFILDSALIPAFAIVDSHDIHLRGWRVLYEGGLPIDMNTGFYIKAGRYVPSLAEDPPAAAFQQRETDWLAARRGVRFAPGAKAPWHGPTNASALFFIDGDTTNVTMSDMRFSVPPGTGANHFIPMVFSMTYGVKPGASIITGLPITQAQFAVPSDLNFSNITIDGAYMGWQGNARYLTIRQVRSLRYGDLQDEGGGEIGGASIVDGKMTRWFAPPHLIYLNYQTAWDPSLYNKHIHIISVNDAGLRVGLARDNLENCCSGNALSLKIGAVDSDVTDYNSNRPDGLLDVLNSDHLLLRNISGRYDSAFLNNLYPGIRFPGNSYKYVTLQNVMLIDDAPVTLHAPIGLGKPQAQQDTVFQNVTVELNAWFGDDAALLAYPPTSPENSIAITYRIGKNYLTLN